MPNDIIKKILYHTILSSSYKDLIEYTSINKYYHNMIHSSNFKENRLILNPEAIDTIAIRNTNKIMDVIGQANVFGKKFIKNNRKSFSQNHPTGLFTGAC